MLGSNDGFVLDAEAAARRLAELSRMLGVCLDPGATTGSLALGQQQQIEIVKALWKGSRVLILDEPTSMLTPQGIAELQKVLLSLKAQGLAIIFITHKLHEALAIGDRVVILKQGRVVGEIASDVLAKETPQQLQRRIVGLMFGEQPEAASDIAELREEASVAHEQRALSEALVLEVIDVVAHGEEGRIGIDGVTLRIRGGEILGVAASMATASRRWHRSSPDSSVWLEATSA
jgi:simple sugar transport system ATP-binding protein